MGVFTANQARRHVHHWGVPIWGTAIRTRSHVGVVWMMIVGRIATSTWMHSVASRTRVHMIVWMAVMIHGPMPIWSGSSRVFPGGKGRLRMGRPRRAFAFARMLDTASIACSGRIIRISFFIRRRVFGSTAWGSRRSTGIALANLIVKSMQVRNTWSESSSWNRCIKILNTSYLHPFCISIFIFQKMFPCFTIILEDNPCVPAIVDGPEDSNFLPNHAIGTEPATEN